MSSLSTPSTAAHTSPRRTITEGKGGHLVHFWAMPSPPPRHRSTSNQTGSPAGCLSSCPPRPLPRPLPIHQVVRVGQRASQGGPPLPAHPAGPLHPAGVPRHIGGHLRRGGGQRGAISGRRGSSSKKFVSGNFARLYCSKYQLFIFSARLCRATPAHRGNGNCT